jgi:hypothetical protein
MTVMLPFLFLLLVYLLITPSTLAETMLMRAQRLAKTKIYMLTSHFSIGKTFSSPTVLTNSSINPSITCP